MKVNGHIQLYPLLRISVMLILGIFVGSYLCHYVSGWIWIALTFSCLLAALLINNLLNVLEQLDDASQRIAYAVSQRIFSQKNRIATLTTLIPTLAIRAVSDQRHRIEMMQQRLPMAIERRLTTQKHLIESLSLKLQGFDPQLLLSRGYSITLHNGRAVRDPNLLKPGDEIETRLAKGSIHSVVKSE